MNMKNIARVILASMGLLVFGSSHAEDENQANSGAQKILVDANVTRVVSEPLNPLSKWQGCSCRVVIKTVGFEHVSTQVQIDWLAEDENGSNGELKVDHAQTIITAGFHTLGFARFYVKSGKLYLELKGVHTYSYEQERYVFLMKGDGKVKQIFPVSEG
jgi:hypothetical protein